MSKRARPPSPKKPSWLAEYDAMMVEARLTMHRNDTVASQEQYRRAEALAETHHANPERLLAVAAADELARQLDQAVASLQKIVHMSDLQARHLAYFHLGSAQYGQKQLDQAIANFREAARGQFPWCSWAINNLGDLHELKALDSPDKNRLEREALKYYTRVIDLQATSPAAPSTYIQRYNRARLLLKRGQLTPALEDFKVSLREAHALVPPDKHSCGLIGRDYGTALFKKAVLGAGDAILNSPPTLKHAINVWSAALKAFDPRFDDESFQHEDLYGTDQDEPNMRRAAIVKLKLRHARKMLEQHKAGRIWSVLPTANAYKFLEWMPASAIQVDGYSSIEERLFTALAFQEEDSYRKYISEAKRKKNASKPGFDDSTPYLAVLRDWASSTPLVERTTRDCRGGGYFLRWRGKGLIIDPGFDFLFNFHQKGFSSGMSMRCWSAITTPTITLTCVRSTTCATNSTTEPTTTRKKRANTC